MDKFFYPYNIAIIGVSSAADNFGQNIYKNLINWNFKGNVFLVHPRGGKIDNRLIYKSVTDIPTEVDLAIIITPARVIPKVLEECAHKDIRNLAILSGGFAELGGLGEELNEEIKRVAKKNSQRFIGPNSVGIINAENGLVMPFLNIAPRKKGNISLISQSGGITLIFLMLLDNENLGFNKIISIGNKEVLDEVDFLKYLAKDKGTEIICLHLESISRGREFFETLKKLDKPVILLKTNITSAGRQVAYSHTAALATDEKIVEVVTRQAQVIRATSLKELINLAKVFQLPPPRGRRVAVISHSGGYTVMAADSLEKYNFQIPPLYPYALRKIRKLCRAGVINLSNPVDLGDVFEVKSIIKTVEIALSQKNIDAVVFGFLRRQEKTAGYDIHQYNVLPDFKRLVSKYKKPIAYTLLANAEIVNEVKKSLDFPVFEDGEETVKALSVLHDYYQASSIKREIKKSAKVKADKIKKKIINSSYKSESLTLIDAFEILKAYKIKISPYHLAKKEREVRDFANKIGYPVVLKVVSKNISHKTEVGGVILNLKNEEEVKQAYNRIILNVQSLIPKAEIEGVLVQKEEKEGPEVIIGIKRDDNFGPVILFGLGGIYTEVLEDISLRLPPLTEKEAEAMIKETKVFRLLTGERQGKIYNIKSLKETLLKISQISCDLPKIKELDINPLKVFPGKKNCVVVDARIALD